ncbi:hypothetical protein OG471_41265 [Streptomyces sp. NBC_01336]|uniref:hypothetical protein n=1 Tax=Streptomyces sp. NBC_01336 TaxID=2903829 RepID=UPI002E0D16D8|nr:hypothetical protein OG471_41265 [Streptomyces sp. NBC_01336]
MDIVATAFAAGVGLDCRWIRVGACEGPVTLPSHRPLQIMRVVDRVKRLRFRLVRVTSSPLVASGPAKKYSDPAFMASDLVALQIFTKGKFHNGLPSGVLFRLGQMLTETDFGGRGRVQSLGHAEVENLVGQA